MALEWRFNAALFDVFAAGLPDMAARVVSVVAFGAFLIWCYWHQARGLSHGEAANEVPRGDWIFGALLLLSPVVNPWYLIWVLPFAVVYRSAWAWTASAAVLLSYVTGLNLDDMRLEPYGHPWWVRPVEFGMIGLALCWDATRRSKRRANPYRLPKE